MRCIYLVPNGPISPNYSGGGSAIYYEQLLALAELNVEIYLWHFCYASRLNEFERFMAQDLSSWQDISSLCRKVFRTTVTDRPNLSARFANKLANRLSGFELRNPLIRSECYPVLKRLMSDIEPDIIWAQHLVGAQVALLQNSAPVVYSHHDWIYKVKGVSDDNGDSRRSQQSEENTSRRAAAVVSGSMVECGQLRDAGCRNVHYIPVAFEPLQDRKPNRHASNGAKLIHLGGLGTTANRIGLERFFDVVWGKLGLGRDDMMVVGDMSSATDSMKEHLAQVSETGYVADLSTVMRPYDIHVIPWEYETGQRTRLVCAFNHRQAVVATRKSVSCFPEVIDRQNCLMVDSLDDMPEAIKMLLKDERLRRRLGDNARATFETHFTRKALLPRYRQVLDSISHPTATSWSAGSRKEKQF